MKKLKILNLITIFLSLISTYGQVGIGTATVNNGVILQLEASDKGLLFPRVALTSRTATNPLPTSIPTGTIVFNTVTSGVFPNAISPGLHWWSETDHQWTNISTNLDNATLKYTNSETATNYNTISWQNVKLFGNRIINESTAVYSVNTNNHTVTIGKYGLYSISSLLSFDRKSADNSGRISLSARVYVNDTPAGTEQVISPGFTTSISANRGLFSHSFTEYLELNKGDIVSIRIKRTTGTYSNGYGTSITTFLQSGDSSIAIYRIR